jgi:hypothetical protein
MNTLLYSCRTYLVKYLSRGKCWEKCERNVEHMFCVQYISSVRAMISEVIKQKRTHQNYCLLLIFPILFFFTFYIDLYIIGFLGVAVTMYI